MKINFINKQVQKSGKWRKVQGKENTIKWKIKYQQTRNRESIRDQSKIKWAKKNDIPVAFVPSFLSVKAIPGVFTKLSLLRISPL